MLIDIKTGKLSTSKLTRKFINENFEIYCEGLLFYPGLEEGSESAYRLLNSFSQEASVDNLVNKTNKLRGSWSLFIHILKTGDWIACSNHSHQSHMFYCESNISTSFLKLRDAVPNKSNLSEETLVYILSSGRCYSDNIGYNDIKKLDYRNYIHVNNRTIKVYPKRTKLIQNDDEQKKHISSNIISFFRSLAQYNLCLDLTGGTDTRSISLCLHHGGLEFDVAIDSTICSTEETRIASIVADRLGKVLKSFKLEYRQMNSEDLRLAWIACDGLNINLGSYLFELYRKFNGYTLVASGVGGNIYKDDAFFRYALLNKMGRKGNRNLIKSLIESGVLFWWGIPYKRLEIYLTKRYRSIAKDVFRGLEERLFEEYKEFDIIETTNRLLYEFSLNCPEGTTDQVIPRYRPLWEPELVSIANNLSIFQRLNCKFYRDEMGSLNPQIADIETLPYGRLLSTNKQTFILDYLKMSIYHIKKRVNIYASTNPAINRNILTDYVLRHNDLNYALKALIEAKIFSTKTTIHDIDIKLALNILCLYYLMLG